MEKRKKVRPGAHTGMISPGPAWVWCPGSPYSHLCYCVRKTESFPQTSAEAEGPGCFCEGTTQGSQRKERWEGVRLDCLTRTWLGTRGHGVSGRFPEGKLGEAICWWLLLSFVPHPPEHHLPVNCRVLTLRADFHDLKKKLHD